MAWGFFMFMLYLVKKNGAGMSIVGGVFDGKPKGDFSLEIAKSNIAGHTGFEKFGKTELLSTSTPPVDVWNGGGLYTGFPTSGAETMEIFSGSDDDAGGGIGARTVEIFNLLDATGAQMPNITVTLDGLTPVSLGAQTYYRGGTRMKVLTAGSTGANQGQLTLRHTTTTANIFACMPIGNNQTSIMASTVPLGSVLAIARITASLARTNGSAGSASLTVRARPQGGVFNAVENPEVTNSSPYKFENDGYLIFEPLMDLKITVESVSDNGTTIQASGSGILIDEKYFR